MAGKLIALESTNQQLLDKTAKYLSLKLQSEGHSVEVINFPRQKQNSSYYVETHQKGEYGNVNPYAASMFYILDRYDATPQIKQLLASDTTVICKGFRGTSLAKLGAEISDSSARKGFYIWADSLESGTFSVPRPDMAIVLSEELPTLYELCELFPKDYVFALNPTKVRNMLNKLIPPAPAVKKQNNTPVVPWLTALQAAGNGSPFEFSAHTTYAVLSNKSKANKTYASGLREIEVLRAKIANKLPQELAEQAFRFVTPLGIMGGSATLEPQKQYKNSILTAQIAENFEPNFGSLQQNSVVLAQTHRTELDVLQELILPKTELGANDIQRALAAMPIGRKIELLKAYLAGADHQPNEYPLDALQVNIAVKISYFELAELKQSNPHLRYAFQNASPRWGYDIPAEFAAALDEIDDCFVSSLKLHSALESAGEHDVAAHCVLQGHFVQTVITLNGKDIRAIGKNPKGFKGSAVNELALQLQEKFPIITS